MISYCAVGARCDAPSDRRWYQWLIKHFMSWYHLSAEQRVRESAVCSIHFVKVELDQVLKCGTSSSAELFTSTLICLKPHSGGDDIETAKWNLDQFQVILTLCLYTVNLCSNPDDKLQIYRDNFEKAYMDSTERFYRTQAPAYLQQNGVQNYMKYVSWRCFLVW